MKLADNALCSFEEVLDMMDNYNSVSENDTFVQELINRKTTQFHQYLGVEQLLSKEYTEYHDGCGINKVFTHMYPILSISEVNDDPDWQWDSNTTVSSSNYRISSDKRYIVFKNTYLYNSEQNVKVTYTAGYEDIPEDVKLACIKEVVRDFNRRYDFDASSIADGDGSITYVEKGLLKSTKEVLDTYKIYGIS